MRPDITIVNNGTEVNKSNIKYNESNRITLSIHFANMARNQSLIPLKIIFYMTTLLK